MHKFTNATSLTRGVHIAVVLAFVVALSSCSGAGESSSSASDLIPEQAGDASIGSDTSAAEGQNGSVAEVEVELTEAEKEEIRKAEALALEERKAFDVLVFECGQDGDYRSCVDLRGELDEPAERELIARCEILDQVACGALDRTVVADLQVACVYGDDVGSCSSLESAWGFGVDSTYGVDEVVDSATLESLGVDCELGGVVQCAELATR